MAIEREQKGHFKKGKSANPSGRTKGSRNKTTLACIELLEREGEALSRKAIEMALAGDTTALRLCLERIAPPVKERPIQGFKLPAINSIQDVGQALASITDSLSSGELLPSEAIAISNLLDKYQKHYEMSELEQRIKTLEEVQ